MKKHTPGPWVAKEDGKYRDSPWSIDHEDGHCASWAPISTAKGRTLALVVNDDSKRPMDFQEEEMHANAKLIAAAPELLEAAQKTVDAWAAFIDSFNYTPGIGDMAEDMEFRELLALRTAITKATQ